MILVLYAESTEAGNQDILTGFQGRLDLLEQAFGDLDGFALGKAKFGLEALYDVVFRQGHEGGGSGWSEIEGCCGAGVLIASIPFDVKELVLLDNLPGKGLASADHHLRNSKIRWPDQGKRNWILPRHGAEPHRPADTFTQKEL